MRRLWVCIQDMREVRVVGGLFEGVAFAVEEGK